MIKSIRLGTTFRSCFSSVEINQPAKIPGKTDPWYPTTLTDKPNSEMIIGSASPDDTAQALGIYGATIMSPTTIPKIGFPPKLRVAE